MAEERQPIDVFAHNTEAGGNFELHYAELVKQAKPIAFPLLELPFQKNIQFTGREEQLSQISDYLSQQNTLAITNSVNATLAQAIAGLGGVGKSQLAIEYAYRAYEKKIYQVIWFMNGQNLDVDYLRLAAQLKVYGENKDNIIEKTKRKLEELGNYLLIIDDAENYETIKNYLPQTGNNSHVLITTRHRTDWQKMLELGVFAQVEALDYFKKVTDFKEEEREDVIKLVDKLLGLLPLALTQAGAFIKQTGISVKEYIDFFETKLTELWGVEDKARDYSQTIKVTWEITINRIKQKYLQAEDLLQGMSCFAPTPNKIEQSWLSMVVPERQLRIAALGELVAYSIIEKQLEENYFSIHSLVQNVIFNSLSLEQKQSQCAQVYAILEAIYPYKEQEQVEDYSLQYKLLPHLEALLKRLEEYQSIIGVIEAEKTKALALKKAVLLTIMAHGYSNPHLGNNVLKQKILLEHALPILENHWGLNSPEVAKTLVNLGNVYGDLGNACRQKELLERALPNLEAHYGPSHPDVANTLMNLGIAYGDLGDVLKQKVLLERALEIQETHYGSVHPIVAKILGNLGSMYGALGDVVTKKILLERVLFIFEKYYRTDHPEIAKILGNLGNSYGDLGDSLKEKILLKRALKIQEAHYGSNHPAVARMLMSLSNAYSALEDAVKQKILLERALKIQETHYGPEHPEVGRILVNLGTAYVALGDALKAKEILERALLIFEKYYGPEHLEVAKTLTNLGIAYNALGEALKQKMLLERALKIKKNHYGSDHPDVAITLTNLVDACFELQQLKEAKLAAERAYQIFLIHPNTGPQHPHTQHAKQQLDAINQLFFDSSIKPSIFTTFSSYNSNSSLTSTKTSLQSQNITELDKQLRNAANQNNVEQLSRLIQENKNLNVNTKDNGQYQRSALHWAVLKKAIPCIKILLIEGADIHLPDKFGKTSLAYALESENVEVLGLVLSQRYQLSLESPFDFARLLRCSANKGEAKILGGLIEKMPELIDIVDTIKNKRTALHWAVIGNHEECVRLLLKAGARVDIEDAMNKTTVDYAQLLTTAPIIRELLNSQIVNATPTDHIQKYGL